MKAPLSVLRRLTLSLFVISVVWSPAHAGFQPPDNPFAAPAAKYQYARSRDYDVRHMRVVLDIDPAKHAYKGTVTHFLSALRGDLKDIVLDAGANLKIDACRLNGSECRFLHEKDRLTVMSPLPLEKGREVQIEIRYTQPPRDADGRNSGPNGHEGWHWIDADPDRPERIPGFWTQGETNGNHLWVPCYDYPNDKCTSETIVTVPESYTVIGNGSEGKITNNPKNHTRTYRWTMEQPHSTYLLSLVAGEMDVKRANWRGVPLYYTVPKGRGDLIDPSFDDTPDMLTFFSDLLGVKYPYAKYAQNAAIDFGGGMENISSTTLGAGSLTDKRNERAMTSLNAHELAHQWFGDIVTCKDWGDLWLNEGFATFFEQLYIEHARGKDAYDLERQGGLQSYLNEATKNYRRPISTKFYSDQNRLFDSHTYPKGALILHMLRRELGDKEFFGALGHYLKTYAYQPVTAYDLSKAIEDATGRNVDGFFAQWVHKPGHPRLQMSWKYLENSKTVAITVKQVQDTSDGTPIYNTPLTIGLLRNVASSPVERQKVTLDQKEQEFRIASPTRPEAVLIDPDHDLLKELDAKPDDSELTTLLLRAPTPMDRQDAAQRLGQAGMDITRITLFTDALRSETEGTVAATMLRFLGDSKSESVRPLLREETKAKQSVRRAAAFSALGVIPRSEEDIALLQQTANSDTEQYVVVDAALQALAKHDVVNSMEIFQHQLKAKTLNDQLARTALEALAASKQESVLPVLLEASRTPYSVSIRATAAKQLGVIGTGNSEARTALTNLLTENRYPELQEAAINALQARKEKEALPLLKETAANAREERIRKAAQGAVNALEKQ